LNNSADRTGASLLPITVGVVGHRTLVESEIERIQGQIKEILLDIKNQAGETPIFFLTALAVGADQIAAEVALGIAGIKVISILPMPIGEYEKDFKSTKELATFRDLLRDSYQVIEAKFFEPRALKGVRNDAPLKDFENQALRDAAYRDCGRLISRQSHALIAIWDGKISHAPAGTVDTISHRLGYLGEPLPHANQISFWPQEDGVLFHIQAQRNESEGVVQTAEFLLEQIEVTVLNPDADSTKWEARSEDFTIKKFGLLNERLTRLEIPPQDVSLSLTDRLMNAIDLSAGEMQLRFRRLVASLLIFGVLGVFLVDLEHDLSLALPYLLAIFFIIIMVITWIRFVKGDQKANFYEFRTLAEGLRVQSAWLKCGIGFSASDEYIKGYPEVSWIPRAMRSAWFVDTLRELGNGSNFKFSNEITRLQATGWIEGQINYFGQGGTANGAIQRSRRKQRQYERLSLAGICLSLGCVLWDGASLVFSHTSWVASFHDLNSLLFHASLSISAASAAYSQLMAFQEISRQYEMNLRIFERGLEILRRESEKYLVNREKVSEVVIHIGKEALRETATWFALKRDRVVHPI